MFILSSCCYDTELRKKRAGTQDLSRHRRSWYLSGEVKKQRCNKNAALDILQKKRKETETEKRKQSLSWV